MAPTAATCKIAQPAPPRLCLGRPRPSLQSVAEDRGGGTKVGKDGRCGVPSREITAAARKATMLLERRIALDGVLVNVHTAVGRGMLAWAPDLRLFISATDGSEQASSKSSFFRTVGVGSKVKGYKVHVLQAIREARERVKQSRWVLRGAHASPPPPPLPLLTPARAASQVRRGW